MNTKRLSKVTIAWSENFAYALGLITTDGNLSIDGRHISFTTKDLEQAITYRHCLGLDNKIGRKARGYSREKRYFVVQFGDRNFYEFLLSIGLRPAKSKTLSQLIIPDEFFSHFLRGCIDGDGCINTVSHPESRHPQLRVRIYAHNPEFLRWLHIKIKRNINTGGGWIYTDRNGSISTLTFAKEDSIKILRAIYSQPTQFTFLTRKYKRAIPFLGE